ncbi:MAG TPA: peptidoglycan-binding protein [Herpetosiphonaceae bacterium]
MWQIGRRFALAVMVLAALLAQSFGPAPAAAQEAKAPTGIAVRVRGADGAPVAGASVLIEPLGLRGVTDGAGQATFANLGASAKLKTVVTVEGAGYRTWILKGAALYPNDTLQIDAELTAPTAKAAGPEIVETATHRLESGQPAPEAEPDWILPAGAAGTDTAPPTTIRVYRTRLGRIDTVDFRTYVKHVLPNEWVAGWRAESLRSGAMASKTYAWYRTMYAKYPGAGYDTKDTTADQVYDPSVSYASTDAAVDATWGYKFTRNSKIFQTQYCAGTYNSSRTSGQCGEKHGFTVGNYMSQWGSKWYADNGYTWQHMINFYYSNVVISAIGGGGTLPMPAWPTLREGDNNNDVKAAQYLLRQRGSSITADGDFGPATRSAVVSFQSANGLTADGVIGPNTFAKLVVTVREGDNNNAVRAIQTLLGVTADGAFGSGTKSAVTQHQARYGLTQDGIVGPQTWQSAFGK